MDRTICGVCGSWLGDDELIASRAEVERLRALLRQSARYVLPDDADARKLSDRIDAALDGKDKP